MYERTGLIGGANELVKRSEPIEIVDQLTKSCNQQVGLSW